MASHLLRKAETFCFVELASQVVLYCFCGAFSKKLCQCDYCKLKSLLPLKFPKCVAFLTLEHSIVRIQANGLFVGCQCLVVAFGIVEGVASIVLVPSIIRIQANGLFVGCQ